MRAVPWVVAAVAAVLAASIPSVHAQETPPAPAAPAPPDPSPGPSPTPPPAPPAPFVAGYKNGFTLQSETGDFVLKLTGYSRPTAASPSATTHALVTNQFLLRRVRPIVQGTVAQYFDFYIVPDFGERHRPRPGRLPRRPLHEQAARARGEDEVTLRHRAPAVRAEPCSSSSAPWPTTSCPTATSGCRSTASWPRAPSAISSRC